MDLDRRQVVKRLALGGLGAATAPLWSQRLTELAWAHVDPHTHTHAAPAAKAAAWTPKVLDAHQNETVVAISELIIPQTDTPGAKAANVNRFIDQILAAAQPAEREQFLRGLQWMDARAQERHGTAFVTATPAQQAAILTAISTPDAGAEATGREFFAAIKGLTVTGYYTSEIGIRQELGDDGALFFAEFPGCTHPQHRG